MTFGEFDKYQEELIAECVKIRDTKGKEYAHSENRFANFNRLSGELGVSNITVAWVYLKKHLDSIASYVKDSKTYSTEPIRGRIVDAIVYLTLIGGMIENGKKGAIPTSAKKFIFAPGDIARVDLWTHSELVQLLYYSGGMDCWFVQVENDKSHKVWIPTSRLKPC